jgi:4,5-dihydroxyphthalate decarboxylase
MVLRMTDCQDVSKEPVRHRLSVAFLRNPRIEPLVDGSVAPAGTQLDWEFGAPSRLQARMARDDNGEVFEYSLTQYMRFHDRAARPESGWTGLPVFLSRAPVQLLLVPATSPLRSLAELRGKKVGVTDYGAGAAVWLRIILRTLYGIRPAEIEWAVSAARSEPDGNAFAPGVTVRTQPSGGSLTDSLRAGDLDAALDLDNALNAKGVLWSEGLSGVRLLLPPADFARVLARFSAQTGARPVNHLVAMQAQLARDDPGLPRRLYDAFESSKEAAYRRDSRARALFTVPEVQAAPTAWTDRDPYPSGLAANRTTLELMTQDLEDCGLISRGTDIARLFHGTLQAT